MSPVHPDAVAEGLRAQPLPFRAEGAHADSVLDATAVAERGRVARAAAVQGWGTEWAVDMAEVMTVTVIEIVIVIVTVAMAVFVCTGNRGVFGGEVSVSLAAAAATTRTTRVTATH